jgi:hypothetical protein
MREINNKVFLIPSRTSSSSDHAYSILGIVNVTRTPTSMEYIVRRTRLLNQSNFVIYYEIVYHMLFILSSRCYLTYESLLRENIEYHQSMFFCCHQTLPVIGNHNNDDQAYPKSVAVYLDSLRLEYCSSWRWGDTLWASW